MGTSSSNGGPKGKTPLLPNWAIGGNAGSVPTQDDNSDAPDEGSGGEGIGSDSEESEDSSETTQAPSSGTDYTDNWQVSRSSFTRYVRSGNGSRSSLSKAVGSYVKSMGGHSKATKAASKGISVGGGYVEFLGGVRRNGLEQTLQDYGLSDCIGKSTQEALAMIAQRISPIGTTNDEIIARGAVMSAIDSLYSKLVEQDDGIAAISNITEAALKESVLEYISAYIFKKWIYELGAALEKNELSAQSAIALENQVKTFIRDEVKASLKDRDILKLDFRKGDGKKIVENIFALAYSTLER